MIKQTSQQLQQQQKQIDGFQTKMISRFSKFIENYYMNAETVSSGHPLLSGQ